VRSQSFDHLIEPLGASMLFMVIENFRNQDAKAAYGRFREKGRQ
jgi:hypothetical protein